VDAILFRMEQAELTRKDQEPYIGKSGRVSEVLNRKRPLTLDMIRKLWDGLHIPLESLIGNIGCANRQQHA
jgi:HTH-type transcriptional regulator / antitoxin HigA